MSPTLSDETRRRIALHLSPVIPPPENYKRRRPAKRGWWRRLAAAVSGIFYQI